MTEDSSHTAQDLSALCRQAGQRAVAWQPAPQAAGPARTRVARWGLVAAACALALATLVALAARLGHEPEPARTAARTDTAPQGPLHAAATPGLPEPIRWQGDELAIDLDAVPLQQAVVWLAEATHSTVAGIEQLKPAPVALHYRGRDVNAAWRLLLQGQAAVALSCGTPGCRVWIGGEAPRTPHVHPQPAAAPAEASAGENESQPDGAC